jgi:hypothetical protein
MGSSEDVLVFLSTSNKELSENADWENIFKFAN